MAVGSTGFRDLPEIIGKVFFWPDVDFAHSVTWLPSVPTESLLQYQTRTFLLKANPAVSGGDSIPAHFPGEAPGMHRIPNGAGRSEPRSSQSGYLRSPVGSLRDYSRPAPEGRGGTLGHPGSCLASPGPGA